MVKINEKSSRKLKTPFRAYYDVIGKACGCSGRYAKAVLTGAPLGKYKDKVYKHRDTPLTRRIKQKAQELEQFINPQK